MKVVLGVLLLTVGIALCVNLAGFHTTGSAVPYFLGGFNVAFGFALVVGWHADRVIAR